MNTDFQCATLKRTVNHLTNNTSCAIKNCSVIAAIFSTQEILECFISVAKRHSKFSHTKN